MYTHTSLLHLLQVILLKYYVYTGLRCTQAHCFQLALVTLICVSFKFNIHCNMHIKCKCSVKYTSDGGKNGRNIHWCYPLQLTLAMTCKLQVSPQIEPHQGPVDLPCAAAFTTKRPLGVSVKMLPSHSCTLPGQWPPRPLPLAVSNRHSTGRKSRGPLYSVHWACF